MAEASRPTPLAEVGLKRAARYLVGSPVTEWHCPLQDLPATADVGRQRLGRSGRREVHAVHGDGARR
eukprot:1148989-Pyramimonas_sp.AAC.1